MCTYFNSNIMCIPLEFFAMQTYDKFKLQFITTNKSVLFGYSISLFEVMSDNVSFVVKI